MKQKIKKFFTLNRRSNGGFTLVELVVVIAILAILAGAAVPAYSGYINKANEAADQQLLAAMNTAYASACAAEGESHIGRGDVPTTIQLVDKKVPTELIGDPAINDNFKMFFPDGQFKRFTELGFNAAKGVFVSDVSEAVEGWLNYIWNKGKHSFVGKEGDLLDLFDTTGVMLGAAGLGAMVDPDMTVEEYLNGYLGNCSDDFLAATGLEGIFGDLFGTMKMEDDEINAYIEAYEKEHGVTLDEAGRNGLITTIKGNKAVMLFAQEAANANADAVKSDVDNFMQIVKNASDPAWQSDPDNVPDGYSSMEDYVTKYVEENPPAEGQLMDSYMAAYLSAAAEKAGTTNSTGVSTLGSLYALSAGYYNQEGSKPLPGTMSLGSFDAFVYAATQDPVGFSAYYKAHGSDDVDAYLAFAGALSQGDINEMDPEAFAGMGDYINGIIGGGN